MNIQKSTPSGIAVFEEYSNSLAEKNFFKISEVESSLTISKSLESGLQISEMKKMDKSMLIKLIGRIIDTTSMFFNVSKNMDEFQTLMIANEIADNYQFENIEDIILCFKYARAGRYGAFSQLYGRIDGEVIFNWLNQYLLLKAEEREKQLHNQKFESMIHPDVAKAIGQAIKDYDEKKKETHKQPVYTFLSMETWVQFVDENMQNMTYEQLSDIVKKIGNENLYGSYSDFMSRINRRLQELKEVLK